MLSIHCSSNRALQNDFVWSEHQGIVVWSGQVVHSDSSLEPPKNVDTGMAFVVHQTVHYRMIMPDSEQYLEHRGIVVSSGATKIELYDVYIPPRTSSPSRSFVWTRRSVRRGIAFIVHLTVIYKMNSPDQSTCEQYLEHQDLQSVFEQLINLVKVNSPPVYHSYNVGLLEADNYIVMWDFNVHHDLWHYCLENYLRGSAMVEQFAHWTTMLSQ